MGVVNVKESWSGASFDDQQDGAAGAAAWGATRQWTVLTDDVADGPATVLDDSRVPRIGTSHNRKPWLRAIRRRAIPKGPMFFHVEVEYAGKDSPLLERPDYGWTWVHSTEPVDRDANGDAMANPLGHAYTGISRKFSDLRLTYTRNEASFSPVAMLAYADAVNSDTFWGAKAGLAQVQDISGKRIVDGTGYYWNVTYVIDFRKDGWKHRTACQGLYYYKNDDSGKKRVVPAVDANGSPLTTPVKLKANGELLPEGSETVWEEFQLYPRVAFAGLGLTQ